MAAAAGNCPLRNQTATCGWGRRELAWDCAEILARRYAACSCPSLQHRGWRAEADWIHGDDGDSAIGSGKQQQQKASNTSLGTVLCHRQDVQLHQQTLHQSIPLPLPRSGSCPPNAHLGHLRQVAAAAVPAFITLDACLIAVHFFQITVQYRARTNSASFPLRAGWNGGSDIAALAGRSASGPVTYKT